MDCETTRLDRCEEMLEAARADGDIHSHRFFAIGPPGVFNRLSAEIRGRPASSLGSDPASRPRSDPRRGGATHARLASVPLSIRNRPALTLLIFMVLLFQHPAGLGHGTPRSPVCKARVTTSSQ